MALRVLCVTRSIFVTVVWRRQLRHGGHINVPQEWNGGHVIVTPQWVELTHFLCYAKHKIDASKPWSSQLWTQFKQLRIQAWKSQDFNGVWTRDLAIPVRRSNQLSYEATDVESWSFVSSNEPVKSGCEVIYVWSSEFTRASHVFNTKYLNHHFSLRILSNFWLFCLFPRELYSWFWFFLQEV